MKVCVVYNGFNAKTAAPEELELREMGLSARKALEKLGYDITLIDMDNLEDIKKFWSQNFDAAFNVCERYRDDAIGEAYCSAFLEMMGIPHTRALSSLLIQSFYKPNIKAILEYHKIPTPRYQVFKSKDDKLGIHMRFPMFVKCASTENSIGIDDHSFVENESQLRDKIGNIIDDYKQDALVEEFIDGREFNVAIIGTKDGPIVLPISEIVFDDLPINRRICNYSAKWHTETDIYKKTVPKCPAEITPETSALIKGIAIDCYNLLNSSSYVRVDIRFKDNIPYVLEINQNPSIGENGCGFVRSALAHGYTYEKMIEEILLNAIKGKTI